MRVRFLSLAVIFPAAILLLNAQSNPDMPRQPQPGNAPAGANAPIITGSPTTTTTPPPGGSQTSPDSPGLAIDTHKYIIGAEDVLGILVWREPEVSRVVVVRPDGKISMPMIGEVQAAGLSPVDLGNNLVQALTKFIRGPEVLVSVQAVNSKKYYIDGQVSRPGEYRLITPTTILEALSQAGGFRDFANMKKIRVLRGATTLKFNYKDVSHGKHMEENIFVQSGDHIIVP